MNRVLPFLLLPVLVACPPAQQPAAEDPVLLADVAEFEQWLAAYKRGEFRVVKEDRTDEEALARVDALLAKIAKWDTLATAKKLFDAASVDPVPPGATSSTELIDFHRELQPWRIQAIAARHLRTMKGQGVIEYLLSMLSAPSLRSATKNQAQKNAAAALRVLGGHPSVEAQMALMVACRSMPAELRVHAVNAMADGAAIELAPTLIELLRDVEPNVRIAAANALGAAISPHSDESLHPQVAPGVAATRDEAIAKLLELLQKDKIWQVRTAAAFALASMRCKNAIPALIDGLDAELKRKKDPWAMDVRLHKLLEGLTGQQVLRGDIALWRQFWQQEGASFTVKPKTPPGKEPPKAGKYAKFFDLEIESDRVLFVLDFSGSMKEPVTVTGEGTAAKTSAPMTKAEMVVQELKKMVLAMPDKALLNVVVFSDGVRVWRQEGGRPALVELDDTARDELLGSFFDSLRPAGPTNLYGALDKAIDFGGRGLHDKYYAAGFDTMYVISDGAPTVGEITDKDEIRRRVREANNLRKLTIHCVTFGNSNDTDFLKFLAQENGGRHIHVD